ncbi:uncharacterized protein ELE39_001387 [Cryptosporidium sp. chipmunk genotype I]|uniref:uncharacterized protein n=1 Tax=Cryptosporidium sp. chipmunk genotype I TaxID=1280935 RepID=UPI00351A8F14|nr:hypothetical protein ELE39_001387 [Cryptosporidium sp. chipmunk genotype I]
MLYISSKGFSWLFTATLIFIFGLLIFSSQAEDLGGEDIVKLVENDHKPKETNNQKSQKSSSEEVVELEEANSSEGTSEVQNPEQVYEACASLQESFEKECTGEIVDKSLAKLVEACSDTIPDANNVMALASEITEAFSDSNFSESTECVAMIYTTSIYISSNSQNGEQEEDESLEVESLETDDSHMESEFENN